ncbi:hypothetical protein CP532_5126 [Ophiocordyceps camponoti-leonardi (nom. inval.)]|nr:hypothetical protein CP532_5126 [Ophiocordyceps camponoti-leonardi (nom. inval.)]
MTAVNQTDAMGTRHRQAPDAAERLSAAPSVAKVADIACEALAQCTSAIRGPPEDRLDAHEPMHPYCSMSTYLFKILGGATFASTGVSIARQVRLQV